jgi:hypothetical protein
VSIPAGTALISHLSYRVLLLAVVGAVGACAVVIRTGRLPEPAVAPKPAAAPEPAANPEPNPRKTFPRKPSVPASLSGRRSKAVR